MTVNFGVRVSVTAVVLVATTAVFACAAQSGGHPCTLYRFTDAATIAITGYTDPLSRLELCPDHDHCTHFGGQSAEGHTWTVTFDDSPLPTELTVQLIGVDQAPHGQAEVTLEWHRTAGNDLCGGPMTAQVSIDAKDLTN